MKSLYIITFLALSFNMYAQENKKLQETEDQAQVLKQAKDNEAQMKKLSLENTPQQKVSTGLASDQGLEVKNKETKAQPSKSTESSGKLLPDTASIEEIKAAIPGRTPRNHVNVKSAKVQGLPNTATLAEIKKTIPKN